MVQLNGFIDTNLPNFEYQQYEAVSKSRLADADTSYKKYYDKYLAADREMPEPVDVDSLSSGSNNPKALGSAIHCCVLEPDKFEETYLIVPKMDKRTTKGKEDFADYSQICREENKIMILEEKATVCHAIRRAIHEHPTAGPLLKKAPLRETSFFWNDPETGLPCKCRLDAADLDLKIILDLKSAADAQDHRIEGANWEYRHHFMPPHYSAGVENVTGTVIEACIFIALEKERPFDIKLYTMDALSLQAGANHIRQLMRGLANCYESGIWPGYDPAIRTVGLPRYALSQYGFDLNKARANGEI